MDITEIAVAQAQKLGELKEAIESKKAESAEEKKLLSHYGVETEPRINLNVDWARIQKHVEHEDALARGLVQKTKVKESRHNRSLSSMPLRREHLASRSIASKQDRGRASDH